VAQRKSTALFVEKSVLKLPDHSLYFIFIYDFSIKIRKGAKVIKNLAPLAF